MEEVSFEEQESVLCPWRVSSVSPTVASLQMLQQDWTRDSLAPAREKRNPRSAEVK